MINELNGLYYSSKSLFHHHSLTATSYFSIQAFIPSPQHSETDWCPFSCPHRVPNPVPVPNPQSYPNSATYCNDESYCFTQAIIDFTNSWCVIAMLCASCLAYCFLLSLLFPA